jgi:hypothetical protein
LRFIAGPFIVDPLGSCAIGASVFPLVFLGLFAIWPVPTALEEGRETELPTCIPPRAIANELGKANAIANAIVVTFMGASFR